MNNKKQLDEEDMRTAAQMDSYMGDGGTWPVANVPSQPPPNTLEGYMRLADRPQPQIMPGSIQLGDRPQPQIMPGSIQLGDRPQPQLLNDGLHPNFNGRYSLINARPGIENEVPIIDATPTISQNLPDGSWGEAAASPIFDATPTTHQNIPDTAWGEAMPAPNPVSNIPTSFNPRNINQDQINKRVAIFNYLQNKYGASADKTELQNARKNAERMNLVANIGSGLDTMATARSQAYGGRGADNEYWKGLKSDAQERVQNATGDRAANIQDFINKNNFERQGVSDLGKQQDMDYETARRTPLSPQSLAAVNSFNGIFGKELKLDPATTSAEDVDRVVKIQMAKQSQEQKNAFSVGMLGVAQEKNKIENSKLDKGQTPLDKARVTNLEADTKLKNKKAAEVEESDKITNYLNEKVDAKKSGDVARQLTDKVNSSRAGKAFSQAGINMLNADNALDIVKRYNGDLNKMSITDKKLLIDEISKIAKGGVPDAKSLEVMENPTLAAKTASALSFITNKVHSPQAGEFLAPMVEYVKDLKETSKALVRDTQFNYFNAYAPYMSKKDADLFLKSHPDVYEIVAEDIPEYQLPELPPKRKAAMESANVKPNRIQQTPLVTPKMTTKPGYVWMRDPTNGESAQVPQSSVEKYKAMQMEIIQ